MKDQARAREGHIEFRRGLTFRSLMLILILELLFLPVTVYTNLVTGISILVSAAAIVPLITSLIASMYGIAFSVQEVFMIYAVLKAVITFVPPYYWLVYRSFFVKFPFLRIFRLGGVSIQELVPTWITPPPSSPVHFYRTLLHPQWLASIGVITTMTLLIFGADLVLAIIFAYLFIEIERLPFPFARVDASLVTTLVREEEERAKLFYIALFAGILLSAVVYVPHMLGTPLIPLPWADFTIVTQYVLPGALIALATDPSLFVGGFVLSPTITLLMFLGSAIVWIIGNNVLVTYFKEVAPEWASEYYIGMCATSIYQRSFLRVWIAFQLGTMVGFPLIMTLIYGRELIRAIRSLSRLSEHRGLSYVPHFKLVLLLYPIFSLASVALFHMLVPDYPILVSIPVSLGLSFLISFLVGRTVAEIGITPTFTWPWQAITYMTRYEGVAGWIFAPYISVGGNALHINSIMVAYLTETRISDYVKGVTIGFILSLILGLIFMDLFWRLAPIPSAAYPYTIVLWPTLAMNDALFITRKITIRSGVFSAGILIGALLPALEVLLRRRDIRAFSGIAIMMGFFLLPPYTLALFIGSCVGNFLIRRAMGRERWINLRDTIVAGFFAGSSVAIGMGIAATMIAKATWIWPW